MSNKVDLRDWLTPPFLLPFFFALMIFGFVLFH